MASSKLLPSNVKVNLVYDDYAKLELTAAGVAFSSGSREAVFPLEPREVDNTAWSDLFQQKVKSLFRETAEVQLIFL
jgi:hypothetical protein